MIKLLFYCLLILLNFFIYPAGDNNSDIMTNNIKAIDIEEILEHDHYIGYPDEIKLQSTGNLHKLLIQFDDYDYPERFEQTSIAAFAPKYGTNIGILSLSNNKIVLKRLFNNFDYSPFLRIMYKCHGIPEKRSERYKVIHRLTAIEKEHYEFENNTIHNTEDIRCFVRLYNKSRIRKLPITINFGVSSYNADKVKEEERMPFTSGLRVIPDSNFTKFIINNALLYELRTNKFKIIKNFKNTVFVNFFTKNKLIEAVINNKKVGERNVLKLYTINMKNGNKKIYRKYIFFGKIANVLLTRNNRLLIVKELFLCPRKRNLKSVNKNLIAKRFKYICRRPWYISSMDILWVIDLKNNKKYAVTENPYIIEKKIRSGKVVSIHNEDVIWPYEMAQSGKYVRIDRISNIHVSPDAKKIIFDVHNKCGFRYILTNSEYIHEKLRKIFKREDITIQIEDRGFINKIIKKIDDNRSFINRCKEQEKMTFLVELKLHSGKSSIDWKVNSDVYKISFWNSCKLFGFVDNERILGLCSNSNDFIGNTLELLVHPLSPRDFCFHYPDSRYKPYRYIFIIPYKTFLIPLW